MSTVSDCYACILGNHAEHVSHHGLRKGLIGGAYCNCKGDCADRSGEAYRRMMNIASEGDQA